MTPEQLMAASRAEAQQELADLGIDVTTEWNTTEPIPGVTRVESFDEYLESLPGDENPEQAKARVLGAATTVGPQDLTRGDVLFILNMNNNEYFALKSPYKAAWEQVLSRLDDARSEMNAMKIRLLNDLPAIAREFVHVDMAVSIKSEDITASMMRHRAAYDRKIEANRATIPTDPAKIKKQCTGCLLVKKLTEFHARRDRPDGRENRCKECRRNKIKSIKRAGL